MLRPSSASWVRGPTVSSSTTSVSLNPSLPAFASRLTRSLALMVFNRRAVARSRNWSLAHSSISLPCVSRIERQRDGPFVAPLIGGAASLGARVSLEEGWVKLEEVSMELGAEIFMVIELPL